jgi:hypothetical protein
MPLTRYFAWVGSVLLALLLVVDACLPKPSVSTRTDGHLAGVRIHSDQKWPERLVYDTGAPMPAAIPEAIQQVPPALAVVPLGVRDALTQMKPSMQAGCNQPIQQGGKQRHGGDTELQKDTRAGPCSWWRGDRNLAGSDQPSGELARGIRAAAKSPPWTG